jgi:hypothetical protein
MKLTPASAFRHPSWSQVRHRTKKMRNCFALFWYRIGSGMVSYLHYGTGLTECRNADSTYFLWLMFVSMPGVRATASVSVSVSMSVSCSCDMDMDVDVDVDLDLDVVMVMVIVCRTWDKKNKQCRDITVRHKTVTLQNGKCYKTVHIKKRYVLQNCTRYKTVRVTKRLRYKTVHVTQRYVTKRSPSQNSTLQSGTRYRMVHFFYCAMKAPTHGLVGHLP